MDNRFLIDTIPESAVYTMPAIFFNGITDENAFFDRVQMADLRWTQADIDRIAQSRVSSEFARIFEIKDARYTSADCRILRSICLFKLGKKNNNFEHYYNGLKDQVSRFESGNRKRNRNQKLRIYVADDCWEDLHQDGILKAQHTDFVRMRSSSPFSTVGTVWRALGYHDTGYEYAYAGDTDTSLDRRELTDSDIFGYFPDDRYHFVVKQRRFIRRDVEDTYTKFYHVLLNIYNTEYIGNYARGSEMRTVRGPVGLPFGDVVPFLESLSAQMGQLHKIYDPERDMWTQVTPVAPWGGWILHMGFMMFYLSKVLQIKIIPYQSLIDSHNSLSDLHFSKRLMREVSR